MLNKDNCTGHSKGDMGQPSTAAESRWRRRPCPSGGNTQGKPCTLPPQSTSLLYQLPREDQETSGTRTRQPWDLFSSQLHGHFRSCRTDCVFKNLLFHSDQLKEIKLRRPLLSNSDLQVGGQGECHPCCCPVAMELLTAIGLRLGLGRCAVRGPVRRPPACHRGTESGLSGCVFNGVKSTWFVYFSFNLGHFVSLSENIT